MTILVTGGAGYIGSHVVHYLTESGEDVVVCDDLSTGHANSISKSVPLIVADLRDYESLKTILGDVRPEAVMHFAAATSVSESQKYPEKYFSRNVLVTKSLLDAMRICGTNKIVFSSTAAVYGTPTKTPITESDKTLPINNYGRTKLICEKLLARYSRDHQIRNIRLRYFNAAGAHGSGDIGEHHEPETHLIPIVLQTALGQREAVRIYGSNYPTRDGTCIRDYVHVDDLADAHFRSLSALREGRIDNCAFNLGSEGGYTVREVIDSVRRVTGQRIETIIDHPRDGDPAVLVACSNRAQFELGWKRLAGGLDRIIETAWRWHRRNPWGYRERFSADSLSSDDSGRGPGIVAGHPAPHQDLLLIAPTPGSP